MIKKYQVEITATAEADVAEIWAYIAQDNARAATSFISRIEQQIDTLEAFPERCPPLPENGSFSINYRHLLHGNYRTIFKIVGDKVIILRILHGARLLEMVMLEI